LDSLLFISLDKLYQQDQTVFRHGQTADRVFRVISGEVHLYRHDYAGKRVLIFRAYEGDYFAEASLYSKEYHCTALCVKPSRVQSYSAKKLLALLQSDSCFSISWIARLSSELRRQRATTERLHLKSAVDRVVHYLMTEGDPAGEIKIKGTLSEIAEILGLTRETLYRALAKMEKAKQLERSGDLLRLTDAI